jgi:hypothetical protein
MGTAFGYFPVFISNSVILVAGGFLISRNRRLNPGAHGVP